MDHAHYRERSAEVRNLLDEVGVPVEPVSLDEAYLDLSEVSDPIAQMSALVGRIREETGLELGGRHVYAPVQHALEVAGERTFGFATS